MPDFNLFGPGAQYDLGGFGGEGPLLGNVESLFDGGGDAGTDWVADALGQFVDSGDARPSVYQSAQAGPDFAVNAGGPSGVSISLGTSPAIGKNGGRPMGDRAKLLATASANAGMRITTKKLRRLLKDIGIDALIALTKLSAQYILWLLETAPRRGGRGMFLRTAVKKVRQGQRVAHTLAKYARRAGIHQHRAAPAPFKRKARR